MGLSTEQWNAKFTAQKPVGPQASFSMNQSQVTPGVNGANNNVDTYGATFPATPGEGPLMAGAKAIGNTPSSGFNLLKGIYNAVRHPINTIRGIDNAILGGVSEGVDALTGTKNAPDQNTQTFDALAKSFKDRYGSLDNLQRTATNDPVGFGADVLTILEGGAGALDAVTGGTKAVQAIDGARYVQRASDVLASAGEKGTMPIEASQKGLYAQSLENGLKTATAPAVKATQGVVDFGKKTVGFGVNQLTGLNPSTVSDIVKNPEAYSQSARAANTQESLANDILNEAKTKVQELSDTGKAYEGYRNAKTPVTLTEDIFNKVLDKYGIKNVDGELKFTKESVPLSAGEKSALQNFIDTYGSTDHTSNSFLNARQASGQLSEFGKQSDNANRISRDLYEALNKEGRPQINGLEATDAKYAPDVEFWKKIQKDLFNVDGTFKDGAVRRIANATGKGKENLLARLEELKPGITQRIKSLKAAEDIANAYGQKVGTYLRSTIGGGGLFTGNIPAIITAILANPEVATKILQGYGYTKKTVGPIIQALVEFGNKGESVFAPAASLSSKNEDMNKNLQEELARAAQNLNPAERELFMNLIQKGMGN